MTITLSLDKMSVSEKIQTMELLWDSICHDNADISSPAWHGDVLSVRETLLTSHAENFEDWNKAKSDIAKKINSK